MIIYTYIIQSLKDSSFYTGISDNPEKRLKQHNRGSLKTTSRRRPWRLIYKKAHSSYREARKHEKWLKKKNIKYKRTIGGVNRATAW